MKFIDFYYTENKTRLVLWCLWQIFNEIASKCAVQVCIFISKLTFILPFGNLDPHFDKNVPAGHLILLCMLCKIFDMN